MALTVPIMVNNQRIGGIAIQRTAPFHADIDVYHYKWEIHMDGDAPCHYRGSVEHTYSDGALELIRKVLDAATLKE